MQYLEEVLQALGSKEPFRKKPVMVDDGIGLFPDYLTKSGNQAYSKLVSILDFLQENNLIEYNIDQLDKWVDDVSMNG